MSDETDMIRWSYFLVRWVPNPRRGEYVNVAAVVYNDSTEDGLMIQSSHLARANRLGKTPDELPEIINRMLHALWMAQPEERDFIAKRMRGDHRNLVQFSESMPMAVTSAEEGMGYIFDHMVGEE